MHWFLFFFWKSQVEVYWDGALNQWWLVNRGIRNYRSNNLVPRAFPTTEGKATTVWMLYSLTGKESTLVIADGVCEKKAPVTYVKYDEFIKNGKTAKQLLWLEDEGLISPKEYGDYNSRNIIRREVTVSAWSRVRTIKLFFSWCPQFRERKSP